jgi:hypothetical protein
MTCRPLWNRVPKKSVARVARVVMTVVVPAQAVTVPPHPAVLCVVRLAAMPHRPMAVTNPQRPPLVPPMPRKPPLSASAKSPRQLQQLTVPKENKHAATRS